MGSNRLKFHTGKIMVHTVILLLVLSFPFLERSEAADRFPSAPVKFIIPASAGGGLGTEIRLIAPFLEKYLGVKTIVEYVSGAEGIIAYNKFTNTTPNGYTLVHCTYASAIALELTRESAKFVVRNFSPVAAWTIKYHGIFVHPDNWKHFSEFLEEGRKRKISVAGTGGSPDIQGRLMSRLLGMEFNTVPYSSSGESMAAVAGKHIESVITFTSGPRQLVKSGKLKALTIFSTKRDRILPEVPSIAELGYDKVPLLLNPGILLAPPRTPKNTIAILERAVQKAIADPAFINLAEKSAVIPEFRSSSEAGKLIADCYELLNTNKDLLK